MLPTGNDSPTNQSFSSNSTTPPSETTFADEAIDNVPANSRSHMSPQKLPNLSISTHNDANKLQQQQTATTTTTTPLAINTDYDSSAAEDNTSYNLSKYESAEHALLSYSRTNKIDKLQKLLEAKLKNEISLNLNYKGQQKQNFSWSALHLACYFGHTQVVEQLLSKKQLRNEIDVNIQNNSCDTPLHKATLTDRQQIVHILISNGANVFVKNCDGLLAKQLTKNKYILEMLEAAERADLNRIRQEMFKAVDNCDLKTLQDYFNNHDSLKRIPCTSNVPRGQNSNDEKANQLAETGDEDKHSNASSRTNTSLPNVDFVGQMVDDRGNTLLHLASMRGFKAICIYLLEQGFDPFRKNNLNQSCVDLASYQLRQMFLSVKPANNQLKRLSQQRTTRFEGPLMKKVRILGWRQIYVVLENGVILLFNHKKDSINQSRRGYKYLESASCEPDPNEIGIFNLCFSDRSRATFLISQDHLQHYTTFNSSYQEQARNCKQAASSQIELIRQKWIDSIRDHIVYSTEFVRKGLKYDDEDDDANENLGGDVANLNYLLPIDTIKSFIHESRAHHNILERHAESLCNMVQAISSTSNLTNSLEVSGRQCDLEASQQATGIHPIVSSTTNSAPSSKGSRLLGLIRSSGRSVAGGSSSSSYQEGNESAGICQQRQQSADLISSTKLRNNSLLLTNEFVQETWPCLLFHLRLLMESTENTKASMSQALALMEHQEQLRQNRIQDQEERCRVLEDSLHALARDHHELEKSLSVSQLYHSVGGCRSMSMSTDLNEYYDAFEEFDDDEKTMTPSSLSSEEELDKRIHEVMNGDDLGMAKQGTSAQALGEPRPGDSQFVQRVVDDESCDDDDDDDDNDDDDLMSNCSALTVETITDQMQYLSAADESMGAGSENLARHGNGIKHRTRLPAPMIPRDQVSIWSILKNCIGKELSKITMPVVFNEPLTMLQRACEGIPHSHYLQLADKSNNPVERMELVCAFIIASLSVNCHRIIKPFNPLLYETYEYDHEFEDGSHARAIAQQVSHHPPITAVTCESDHFIYDGVVNPKMRFWGRSVEVQHDGICRIYLKTHKESYIFKAVPCSVHNIIVGKLWFEHHGPLDIKCAESKLQANLVFKQSGWFSNDIHRFDGFIVSTDGKSNSERKKLRFVYGKWSDYIKSVDYPDYEKYMKTSQQKLFKIPDNPDQGQTRGEIKKTNLNASPDSANNNNNNSIRPNVESSSNKAASIRSSGDKKTGDNKSDPTQSLDIPNSRTIWRVEAQYLSEYYNFTHFTMKLNELSPSFEKTLPKTDSRFRPDVRKLEEGDLEGAASEKQRLEDKQREARTRDKRFKDPSSDFLWFKLVSEPNSKDQLYTHDGSYWDNKSNPEKFPDLF